jgi:hypothetical protein
MLLIRLFLPPPSSLSISSLSLALWSIQHHPVQTAPNTRSPQHEPSSPTSHTSLPRHFSPQSSVSTDLEDYIQRQRNFHHNGHPSVTTGVTNLPNLTHCPQHDDDDSSTNSSPLAFTDESNNHPLIPTDVFIPPSHSRQLKPHKPWMQEKLWACARTTCVARVFSTNRTCIVNFHRNCVRNCVGMSPKLTYFLILSKNLFSRGLRVVGSVVWQCCHCKFFKTTSWLASGNENRVGGC